MPGLDRLYDLYSFNVIPALGRVVTGDAEAYRYLVESIRSFPQPGALRRHDPRRRLRAASSFAAHDRRHRRAAFRLAACDRRDRPRLISSASPAPASCSRARACSALIDPAPLPLPARSRARARAADRAADGAGGRRDRLAAALTRLGPSYVKLGQFLATRPDVVGVALARDLETPAGQDGAVPAGARPRRRSTTALGKPLSRAVRVVRPAGRRRLDRAGAPRRDRDRRTGREPVAVKVLRPGIERRFQRRPRRLLRSPRASPSDCSAEARRLRPVAVVDTLAPLGRARDGPAARSRRALRDGGEHQGRSGLPRAGGRLGAHRARRADARMDRRHAALTTAPRSSAKGLDLDAARPRA